MAEPRWEPVYDPDREWPLTCPWCGHSGLPEPGHMRCEDQCTRIIEWSWCPACETEWADPNHYCSDAQWQAYFNPRI